MSLTVGIVGLPNVGKSTLFNALLKKQQALAANYPFATIEPNVGVVPVPDERLRGLALCVAGHAVDEAKVDESRLPPIVPATVTFTDIAGIVKGASTGEGLGNQFLAHIREVDVIAFVVRAFRDGNVVETGSNNLGEDLHTVQSELIIKDIETVERKLVELEKRKRSQKEPKQVAAEIAVAEKLMNAFNLGEMAVGVLDEGELATIHEWFLLTAKPVIYVVNVGEEDLGVAAAEYAESLGVATEDVVIICAKVEAELSELDEVEQLEYLESLGLKQSGLERFIRVAYGKLGLVSFLTAGEKEVRAWTIRKGMLAPEAAGVIHTDFEKRFIKAQVTSYRDYIAHGGWKGVAQVGKLRMEGRDYMVCDGDVIEFKVGT